MWLLPKELKAGDVQYVINKAIQESRFTATVEVAILGRRTEGVKVSLVRLRNKKPYCGAHPGPCVALFARKHRTGSWLEGLDWIGFNALLNDTLDKLSWSCDVFSYNRESRDTGRYYVRKGRLRRVFYPFDFVGVFAHWCHGTFDDCFADHCGKAPPPMGRSLRGLEETPGYACYTLQEEEAFRAEEV